ncbi:MAG: hypothetical protein M3068_09680 [Gemmatimonadota bacterium]|nr:hypothetical protein [Gemmatimonadota bacterium]
MHFAEGLALVDYWSVLRERYGSRDVTSPYRLLDVFVHRGDQWLLLRHAETHAVASPKPIVVARAILDEYVGRYEWWPGYIETFTRRGNQLFYQGTVTRPPLLFAPRPARRSSRRETPG